VNFKEWQPSKGKSNFSLEILGLVIKSTQVQIEKEKKSFHGSRKGFQSRKNSSQSGMVSLEARRVIG
jgi:hypothetical protein